MEIHLLQCYVVATSDVSILFSCFGQDLIVLKNRIVVHSELDKIAFLYYRRCSNRRRIKPDEDDAIF